MDLQAFAWIGFAAFFVASLVCGVRLVALWHRNRELPELLIGLGVLGIGPVGFGFITIGQLVGAGRPGAAAVFLGLGGALAGTCASLWGIAYGEALLCDGDPGSGSWGAVVFGAK